MFSSLHRDHLPTRTIGPDGIIREAPMSKEDRAEIERRDLDAIHNRAEARYLASKE